MSDQSNLVSEVRAPEGAGHHDDYPALMVGARRKAAPHIRAPAIIRHLGYWIPDKLAFNREAWIGKIEEFFETLLAEVRKKASGYSATNAKDDAQPRVHERITRGTGQLIRHQRFLLSFVWESMPVTLTLELFDEYFALCTVIEASCEPRSKTGLGEAIETFNRVASERYDEIGKTQYSAVSAPQARNFAGVFEVIYDTVWKCFHKEILTGPLAGHAETLGKVFVEFRSFVACRGGRQFIATDRKAEAPLGKEIGNKRFKGSDAVRCVDTIHPFMTADTWLHRGSDDKHGAEEPDRREFTFTPVLNERYIYGSALGTPPPHLSDRHLPLTYMLLGANRCPSELGLLVDGFHMLGSLRLAALYDFPHIVDAALELRELEYRISEVLKNTKVTDAQLAEEVATHSGRLAEIEQGIKHGVTEKTPQIVGGLPFRVERSRYYQQQFRGLVRGLRIGRIEGFLTYAEAVGRRLGGIYDLINTVGHRHERLRETLAALSRRAQTARQLELTGTITSFTSAITTETRAIERLQMAAETGFFLVLFPYYWSSFWLKFFPEHSGWKFPILAASFAAGVALAGWRKQIFRSIRRRAARTRYKHRKIVAGSRLQLARIRTLIRQATRRWHDQQNRAKNYARKLLTTCRNWVADLWNRR